MFVLKEGDSGSYIYALQLALTRAGFNLNKIDGLFGGRTKAAVMSFQKSKGLVPDGIVGLITANALRPYLVGYTTYTVMSGDTLYSIADNLGSTVEFLKTANPQVNHLNLTVGEMLKVPFAFSIVAMNTEYNSLLCELVCEGLKVRYPFIELALAGKSEVGKSIPMLKIGTGRKKVFFNASHHANEWITTPLVLKFAEELAYAVANSFDFYGQNSKEIYNNVSLYIIPMVNPDGVDLVTGAVEKDSELYLNALKVANNYPEIPFPSGWKANIRGVDLNLNYPAFWERARELKFAEGFTKPGPKNFVGENPLSETESRAVYDISIKTGFDITVSFHTQGEEIYWSFNGYKPLGGKELGEKMALASGYLLTEPEKNSGYAGYKDWFVMTYLRPGYTVEAGRGTNPLPVSQTESIYNRVKKIMILALNGQQFATY